MPSPAHAADVERVLLRATQECESKSAWFGSGLPQLLRRAVVSQNQETGDRPELAFVEVSSESPPGRGVPEEPMFPRACPVIGLSAGGIEDLPRLIRTIGSGAIRISRLICAVAVIDFTSEGLRVREIRHGLTAADLQRQLSVPLWSGPDLKEMGTH